MKCILLAYTTVNLSNTTLPWGLTSDWLSFTLLQFGLQVRPMIVLPCLLISCLKNAFSFISVAFTSTMIISSWSFPEVPHHVKHFLFQPPDGGITLLPHSMSASVSDCNWSVWIADPQCPNPELLVASSSCPPAFYYTATIQDVKLGVCDMNISTKSF